MSEKQDQLTSEEPEPKAFYLITGYICPHMTTDYCDQSAKAPDFPDNFVVIEGNIKPKDEFLSALSAAKNRPGIPVCSIHNISLDPVLVKIIKTTGDTPSPPPPARI